MHNKRHLEHIVLKCQTCLPWWHTVLVQISTYHMQGPCHPLLYLTLQPTLIECNGVCMTCNCTPNDYLNKQDGQGKVVCDMTTPYYTCQCCLLIDHMRCGQCYPAHWSILNIVFPNNPIYLHMPNTSVHGIGTVGKHHTPFHTCLRSSHNGCCNG
jgi:hypothetical protein